MRALFHLSKPGNDRSSLRVFSDKLEALIRGLEALGKGVDSYGDLLVCILLDKLNSDVRRNLSRQHGATDWSLDELRNAIKREIEVLEDMTPEKKSNISSKQKTGVYFSESKSTKPKRCAFCTGDHFPYQCKEVSSPEERLKVAKVKRLCLNCLTNNTPHLAKDCKSSFRCRICNKSHHTSLHQALEDKATSESASSDGLFKNDSTSRVTTAVGLNHAASSFQPFIFLKTAIALAKSRCRQHQVNILVDEGSQQSFITAKVAKQLRLQPLWRESLLLSGLLVNSAESNYYDVTKVDIIGRNGASVTVEVVILEQLVEPLDDPYRKVVNSLSYLQGLPLAHPTSELSTFSVNILIGANFFWDLVGDKYIREAGPTAVSSIFGFLISGPLSGEDFSTSKQRVSVNVVTVEQFDLERF